MSQHATSVIIRWIEPATGNDDPMIQFLTPRGEWARTHDQAQEYRHEDAMKLARDLCKINSDEIEVVKNFGCDDEKSFPVVVVRWPEMKE